MKPAAEENLVSAPQWVLGDVRNALSSAVTLLETATSGLKNKQNASAKEDVPAEEPLRQITDAVQVVQYALNMLNSHAFLDKASHKQEGSFDPKDKVVKETTAKLVQPSEEAAEDENTPVSRSHRQEIETDLQYLQEEKKTRTLIRQVSRQKCWLPLEHNAEVCIYNSSLVDATTGETKKNISINITEAAAKRCWSRRTQSQTTTSDVLLEFSEIHAEIVEEFISCRTLEGSKQYLLHHSDILLHENASHYLLLASMFDAINGRRESMTLTTRQSQLVSNIAELARKVNTEPRRVVGSFFQRLQERTHCWEEFLEGVKTFQDDIIQLALARKAEIVKERPTSMENSALLLVESDGLREIIEMLGDTLPDDALVAEAFQSHDVNRVREALTGKMDLVEVEFLVKRCVDLWGAQVKP